jgi:hypothetical protein
LAPVGEPDLGTIPEDWHKDGLEDLLPLYKQEAMHGVAQDAECLDCTPDLCCHGGDMQCPGEMRGKENSEVSEGVSGAHTDGLGFVLDCNRRGFLTIFVDGVMGRVKEHEFSLIRISRETEPMEPVEDRSSGFSYFCGRGTERRSRGIDGPIVDIEGQVGVRPACSFV